MFTTLGNVNEWLQERWTCTSPWVLNCLELSGLLPWTYSLSQAVSNFWSESPDHAETWHCSYCFLRMFITTNELVFTILAAAGTWVQVPSTTWSTSSWVFYTQEGPLRGYLWQSNHNTIARSSSQCLLPVAILCNTDEKISFLKADYERGCGIYLPSWAVTRQSVTEMLFTINFKSSKHKKQNLKEWSYGSEVSDFEAAAQKRWIWPQDLLSTPQKSLNIGKHQCNTNLCLHLYT